MSGVSFNLRSLRTGLSRFPFRCRWAYRSRLAACRLLPLLLAVGTGCGSGGDVTADLLSQLLSGGLAEFSAPSACGPLNLINVIPDCPLGLVCFTTACDDHNACYSSCRASKLQCDLAFLADLRTTCLLRFPLGGPDLRQCENLANVYWLAVSSLGVGAYEASQELACVVGDLDGTPGACCLADSSCVNVTGPGVCSVLGGTYFVENLCDTALCEPPLADQCDAAEVACATVAADDGRCAGADQQTCSVAGQDCEDGSECVETVIDEFNCRVVTDNRLATTDGPTTGGACVASGEDSFQADVWYRYVAPCAGRLIVRMCDTPSYDAMLAVFGSVDGACDCPADNAQLLECNDDFCGPGSVSAVTIDHVAEGACLSIRVGGWAGAGSATDASQGVSELDISMQCDLDEEKVVGQKSKVESQELKPKS